MTAPPTLLVLGDPMIPAKQLMTPLSSAFGHRYQVLGDDWDVDHTEAVATNLRIESHGPNDCVVPIDASVPLDQVEILVTHFFPLSETLLATLPALRIVATARAGTENIDIAHLKRRGIRLVTNHGRNAGAVAELAVGLMLASQRGIAESHHTIRTGGWRPQPPTHGYRELSGRTVGLFGFGAIGQLVARRLSGFDVNLRWFDPYADLGATDIPTRAKTIEGLLTGCDVLSLHARATAENQGVIGARELDLLAADAIVVNTARAELVDEAALIGRLKSGKLAGAALDVFSEEPLPANHPLRTLATVTLTPHLAGLSVDARQNTTRLLAHRLGQVLYEQGAQN